MKVKILSLAAVLTVFLLNISLAQTNEVKKTEGCEKSKTTCTDMSKKECTDKKTGSSQGVGDTVKICPVSGETIDGTEGEPVKLTYLGKEYTFCCAGCLKKFKAEPITYIKEEVKCPVMGEPIDKNISTTVDGVKYYFCCSGCISKFEKDPKKYLDKLGKN